MNREERRRQVREARPVHRTSFGADLVTGGRLMDGSTPTSAADQTRLDRFLGEHMAGIVALGLGGFRKIGRGGVLISVEDDSWLDQQPDEHPAMELHYMSPSLVRRMPPSSARTEVLRKIETYDPVRQVVAIVDYSGNKYSVKLRVNVDGVDIPLADAFPPADLSGAQPIG